MCTCTPACHPCYMAFATWHLPFQIWPVLPLLHAPHIRRLCSSMMCSNGHDTHASEPGPEPLVPLHVPKEGLEAQEQTHQLMSSLITHAVTLSLTLVATYSLPQHVPRSALCTHHCSSEVPIRQHSRCHNAPNVQQYSDPRSRKFDPHTCPSSLKLPSSATSTPVAITTHFPISQQHAHICTG